MQLAVSEHASVFRLVDVLIADERGREIEVRYLENAEDVPTLTKAEQGKRIYVRAVDLARGTVCYSGTDLASVTLVLGAKLPVHWRWVFDELPALYARITAARDNPGIEAWPLDEMPLATSPWAALECVV